MTQRHTEELDRLVQAALRISSTEDLESMCRHILEGAQQVLRSEAASLMLVDEANGVLKWFSALGEAGEMLANHDLSLDEGVAGWVARAGESVLLHDAQSDPRFCSRIDALSGFSTRSLLCVPMIAQGRVLGVLELLNDPADHRYDDDDMHRAQAFASLAATALQNHHLIRVAEEVGNVREISRFKNDLVTRVAEEIRNPLTSVRGFSDVIARDEADVATLRDFAGRIGGEVKRIESMVDGVLELARIEAGHTTVREDAVPIAPLLEAAQARWSERASHHALRLIINEGDAPCVLGDAERISQMLDLLLANAVEWSPDGGPITLRAARQSASWRVSVTDRGLGFPPGETARLFHPFHRLPHPKRDGLPGSGLGLSLIRALTLRMNGQLGADSDPERGTTFWFSLPSTD